MSVAPDIQTATVDGTGRDTARKYRINEMNPYVASGFMLKLAAALRLDTLDDMAAQFSAIARPQGDEPNDDAINAFLKILAGCDAEAIHALIGQLLRYVEVQRDPNHPGVYMPLDIESDMKEMATLRRVLGALIALNFKKG